MTQDLTKLERGWALIAEGAQEISLAYAAMSQPGRVPSASPASDDDLPPLEEPPTPDELLEGVLAVTGGEVVRVADVYPTQPTTRTAAQVKKESAFTECPAHRKPFSKGKFGDYCQSTSEDPNWSNPKGYCTVTPRSAGAWLRQRVAA